MEKWVNTWETQVMGFFFSIGSLGTKLRLLMKIGSSRSEANGTGICFFVAEEVIVVRTREDC